MKGMLEGASDQCSHMMKDTELRMEIETSCQEKKQLPERFMQDVMEQVSAAIFNRIRYVIFGVEGQRLLVIRG